jgi:pimeloyl-ACP methyl ester carboxylesterase
LSPRVKSPPTAIVSDALQYKHMDELFVYEYGSGDDAVVLLHGLVETHKYWTPLLPFLNEKRFRYVIPDLLGHGRSPKPRDEGYNVDSHLRYLMRDVFDGWSRSGQAPVKRIKGPARVIGHGVGAILALEIASRSPDRISQLILIGLPYFHDKYAARDAFTFPLEHVWFYSYLVCLISVNFCRYSRYVSAPLLSRLNKKPPALLSDYMKHARAHAVYRTYLYCIVHHRLDGAARNIRELSYIPIHLIHPSSADALTPLSSAQDFFRRYSGFTELAVFSEDGDLVSFHTKKLAEYLNRELMKL